jgi:16S rRNA (guanine966-N2)-methyltransferase
MRVIAGSAKGSRLSPVPAGVRPLSDRAREGLFASLGTAVNDARVLDLYAGTGAMGIEALSRGASSATFVESSRPVMVALRTNLEKTHLSERATVVASDTLDFLSRKASEGPFDLVLADPPYALGAPELDEVLARLADGWLAEGPWTVVLTRGKKSSSPVIPLHWVVSRQLGYGDSLVILYREVGWA